MSYHIDKHENNRVRAISWMSNSPRSPDYVNEASNLSTREETRNISLLYKDLANEFPVTNRKPILGN